MERAIGRSAGKLNRAMDDRMIKMVIEWGSNRKRIN
jgi:hypothetical protein